MSLRDILLGPRERPLDYGEPEEGFLAPDRDSFSWRQMAFIFVFVIAFNELSHATGLTALLNRYVPTWIVGLLILAYGLFFTLLPILNARARATFRLRDIVAAAFFVLVGALVLFSQV